MIKIRNVYYMLAYAFQVLREKGYSNLATEEFENINNLLGAILAKGTSNQVKRGLSKEYIETNGILTSPHGKINVSEMVSKQLLLHKQVSCNYDEFTANSNLNQIIKSTSNLLIHSDDVSLNVKKQLKKTMIFFGDVDSIDLKQVVWSNIKYNRNNATYKMLINICYLIAHGFLQSEQSGNSKLVNFEDEQRMHSLYEKFILEYYRRHFPMLKAAPSHIAWNSDDGVIDFLPVMRSDITLTYEEQILIIDAKYYGHSMQTGMFNKKTVHSNNLYQIFSYVKNKDTESSGTVSGMLLYAKTDEELTPNFEYNLNKSSIKVRSLDLNMNFADISNQLDMIVGNWIPGLERKKCL